MLRRRGHNNRAPGSGRPRDRVSATLRGPMTRDLWLSPARAALFIPASGLHLGRMSGANHCTGITTLEGPTGSTETVMEPEAEQRLGRLWRVICHDDPHTTMDFVVEVLMTVFRQPSPRAFELMLCVHHAGSALIGSWPESVARKKVARAQARARLDGFPLTFSVEVDD